MKSKGRILFFLLFLVILSGCGENFPRHLLLKGLPPESAEGDITALETGADSVTVYFADQSLTIEPFSRSWDIEADLFDFLKIAKRERPDGISWMITLYGEGRELIKIGKNSPGGTEILSRWTLSRGAILKGGESAHQAGERIWVEVLLDNGSSSFSAFPGEPVTVESDFDKWRFLLLGASIPAENENINRGLIADERASLKADWIIFRRELFRR